MGNKRIKSSNCGSLRRGDGVVTCINGIQVGMDGGFVGSKGGAKGGDGCFAEWGDGSGPKERAAQKWPGIALMHAVLSACGVRSCL